jgi:RNA polymerase sigma factor (TIGR02999 family)
MPTDAMFAMLYGELHRLAQREWARAGPGIPLSATTLLHEAYLDMSRRDALAFPDMPRFLAYAARAMRSIIIDRARELGALKRGGDLDMTSLNTNNAQNVSEPEQLTAVGEALEELAQLEPALAQVVDLKFFCGFEMAEIAVLLGTSERTVHRQWDKAKTLLYRKMQSGG